MVEVFKTNVDDTELVKRLTSKLLLRFPHCRINFDLHDCDKILRIEGHSFCNEEIIAIMNGDGYQCQALE
jgi:hypothetical protein